jgi:hypothetical protein
MDVSRPLFSETVSFTCPGPMRSALREAAAKQVTHLSEFIRRACLKERGPRFRLWAA